MNPTAHALIENVAELTAVRDRETLEAAFARLLLAQFDASSVTYHRLAVVDGVQRAWPAVRATAAGVRRLADPHDASGLAPLDGWKARCVAERTPCRVSSRGDARCTFLFPVLAERETVGLIEAEGVSKLLAPEREIGVENLMRIYRNHLALLDYGEHDTLTSLRNRRTFDADFARLLRRASPHPGDALDVAEVPDVTDGDDTRREPVPDAPHWLAVADVDRFKRINDAFGHLYGDEVLLLLAQTMRAQFRPADRLYRFGGEEFVIVLARTLPEHALAPLERLRESVESRVFSRVGRVTISIGVTRIGPLDDAAGAFGRADAALYHGKQNGRNQVNAWEALVADGQLAHKQTEGVVELF